MWIFLLGLTGFLALHSLRVVAPDWRQRRIAHWGERRWKAVYSLLAIVFFVSMIWGYGQARQDPYWLWTPPPPLRRPAYALVALAFILLTAAYWPGHRLRAWLRHPMLLGTALWAAAHLMLSGWLHGVLLFGAFLLWSSLTYASALRRPWSHTGAPVGVGWTLAASAAGLVGYLLFARFLHGWLIGISPFG